MNLSENTDELFKALAEFQAEVPKVVKDRTVKVKNRQGEFLYSFDYATLGNIIDTTKPVLSKHGLNVVQSVGSEGVRTIITHQSGQFLVTDPLQVDLDGDEQDQGSSITYKKRYQMAGALNIDSDFDDDGNVASGNVPTYEDEEAPREPIKGKGGSSTKPSPKKEQEEAQAEPEPEQEQEPPFDPDETDVDKVLKNAKDSADLIAWWKDFLDEGDEAEKIENHREAVMDRLKELQG